MAIDENVQKGYLIDRDGDKSSKRLWGSVFCAMGGVLVASIGVAAIFVKVADPQTALTAGTTLITVGSGLLIGGVLEGIGQKIGGGGK